MKQLFLKKINKKSLILALAVCSITVSSIAQESIYQSFIPEKKKSYINYEWNKKPQWVPIEEKDTGEESVFILNRTIAELTIGTNNEGESVLKSYLIEHSVIILNSDKSIENNNKIYLSYELGKDYDLRCRVINKNKMITMNDDDIKETDDEQYGKLKYFAIRGLEKGSILEIVKIQSVRFNVNGIKFALESKQPQKHLHTALICPTQIEFLYKTYNDFPFEIVSNTTDKNRVYEIEKDNVPSAKEEPESYEKAQQAYIIFKKNHDNAKSVNKFSIYKESSENYYKFLCGEIFVTSKDKKAAKKWLKGLKLPAGISDIEKIRKIEHELKYNIKFFGGDPKYDMAATVYTKKMGTQLGLFRALLTAFEAAEIPFEIVLTCDRSVHNFDKEFESSIFLDKELIYFPGIKNYIDPISKYNRLGYFDPDFRNNFGLFVKSAEIGGTQAGVGKVKWIAPNDYSENYQNISVDVVPTLNNQKLKVNFNIETFGHNCLTFQQFYEYWNEEVQTKNKEEIVKSLYPTGEIEDITVENTQPQMIGIKPLIAKGNVIVKSLIEKAGDKFLVKIGDLIGPQQEMYAEVGKARKYDVDTRFPRQYKRSITFHIPSGYKVSNLDSFVMKQELKIDDKIICAFYSNYKLDGNKLILEIEEFYKECHVSKDFISDYIKIVNAAADYQKLSLVLEAN